MTSQALRATEAAGESEHSRRLLTAFERVCPEAMRPIIGFAGSLTMNLQPWGIAMNKLRIVTLGFGTARQRMALER